MLHLKSDAGGKSGCEEANLQVEKAFEVNYFLL
jgi:hypothetical protein